MVRRLAKGVRRLRLVVYLLLGATAIITVLSIAGFNVDIAVSGLFYDPATRKFMAEWPSRLASVRENGGVAIVACVASALLGLASYLPWRLPSIRPRAAMFLTISLIVGPGILVNAILKPHWGRPRPYELSHFAGTLPFVNWWDPTGACDSNCSFISGEASAAAWMFGPAMLLPPPWRTIGILAAAAFTVAISTLRMMAGGHFLSDVVIGALSTILILLLMRKLIDPPAHPSGSAK